MCILVESYKRIHTFQVKALEKKAAAGGVKGM